MPEEGAEDQEDDAAEAADGERFASAPAIANVAANRCVV